MPNARSLVGLLDFLSQTREGNTLGDVDVNTTQMATQAGDPLTLEYVIGFTPDTLVVLSHTPSSSAGDGAGAHRLFYGAGNTGCVLDASTREQTLLRGHVRAPSQQNGSGNPLLTRAYSSPLPSPPNIPRTRAAAARRHHRHAGERQWRAAGHSGRGAGRRQLRDILGSLLWRAAGHD